MVIAFYCCYSLLGQQLVAEDATVSQIGTAPDSTSWRVCKALGRRRAHANTDPLFRTQCQADVLTATKYGQERPVSTATTKGERGQRTIAASASQVRPHTHTGRVRACTCTHPHLPVCSRTPRECQRKRQPATAQSRTLADTALTRPNPGAGPSRVPAQEARTSQATRLG